MEAESLWPGDRLATVAICALGSDRGDVHMRSDGTPVQHSIVVVDIERFGSQGRNDLHRVTAHDGLHAALRQALVEANIDPNSCTVQDRGDGADRKSTRLNSSH